VGHPLADPAYGPGSRDTRLPVLAFEKRANLLFWIGE